MMCLFGHTYSANSVDPHLGRDFYLPNDPGAPRRAPLFPFEGPVKQSLTAYSSLPFPQIVGMWRHNLNEFLTSADSNWKREGKNGKMAEVKNFEEWDGNYGAKGCFHT